MFTEIGELAYLIKQKLLGFLFNSLQYMHSLYNKLYVICQSESLQCFTKTDHYNQNMFTTSLYWLRPWYSNFSLLQTKKGNQAPWTNANLFHFCDQPMCNKPKLTNVKAQPKPIYKLSEDSHLNYLWHFFLRCCAESDIGIKQSYQCNKTQNWFHNVGNETAITSGKVIILNSE